MPSLARRIRFIERAVPDVRVSRRGEARIAAGHPWVFRPDILQAAAGADEVRVTGERGRVLGGGLWADEPAPIALRMTARSG